MAQSVEEIKSEIEQLKEHARVVKNQLDEEASHHRDLEIERGAIDSGIDSYTGTGYIFFQKNLIFPQAGFFEILKLLLTNFF